MAYTDFIAAIDLGTSHMVGIVGTKDASGALSIIAHEVEDSGICIRRGCVYKVEETAMQVNRLIKKLENKLNSKRDDKQGTYKIRKVYVGVGGQSIRSIDHTVSKVLGTEGVVTEEIINSLYQDCKAYQPKQTRVLDVVSPSYYLDDIDDKPELNPVGVSCRRIDARYKLIVGGPSLRLNVIHNVEEQTGVKIAGILISPLALADVVLSVNEKDLGCALVDFGAGVTSVSVYKGGQLVSLSVIPLGGHLITKDITTLNVVEAEAERLKVTYGSAKNDKNDDKQISVNLADGMGLREIKLTELNNVVVARMNEILANVHKQIEDTGMMDKLGAGVVITGGAAALKDLVDVMREKLKLEVRYYSSVRKGLVAGGDLSVAMNPGYAVAIGLLARGSENCAEYIPPVPEPKEKPVVEPKPTVVQKPEPEEVSVPENPRPQPKGGLFRSLTKRIENFSGTLFDDDDRKR